MSTQNSAPASNEVAQVATAPAVGTGTGTQTPIEVVVTVSEKVTKALSEVTKAEVNLTGKRFALATAIAAEYAARKYTDKKQARKMLELSYLEGLPTARLEGETDANYATRLESERKALLLRKSAEISNALALAFPKNEANLKACIDYNKTLPPNSQSNDRIGFKTLLEVARDDKMTVESILADKAASKPQGSKPSAKTQAENAAKAASAASTGKAATDPSKDEKEDGETTNEGAVPEENGAPTPTAAGKPLSPREKLEGSIAAMFLTYRTNFGMSNAEIKDVILAELPTYV